MSLHLGKTRYGAPSLTRATVKKTYNENNMNYVDVKLANADVEVKKVAIIADSTGSKIGSVRVPQKDQEVVLGFLDGSMSRAVVIGSLYTSKNLPPLKIDDSNKITSTTLESKAEFTVDNTKGKEKISFVTSKEHKMLLDESKNTFSITSKDGKTGITMDFQKGEINIMALNGITFSCGKNEEVSIKNGDITLKSPAGSFKVDFNMVDIKGKGKISVESNGIFSAKGNPAKLQGNPIMLN